MDEGAVKDEGEVMDEGTVMHKGELRDRGVVVDRDRGKRSAQGCAATPPAAVPMHVTDSAFEVIVEFCPL